MDGNNVYAKYSKNNQAQSLVNECGIDGSSGNNCQNPGLQIIADGAATALTPSQMSIDNLNGNVINPIAADLGVPYSPPIWQFTITNPGPGPVTIHAIIECATLEGVP